MDIVYKVLITILSIIILLSTGLSLTLSIADEIEVNQYYHPNDIYILLYLKSHKSCLL